MIDLVEVFERAEIGPLTSETDYYMKRFVPKLSEIIARHGIKWDKEHHHQHRRRSHRPRLPGGRRPLAEAGAYCPETNRVMQFTRDEILTVACAQCPTATTFGEGRERKVMRGRRPDTTDDRPWVHVGGGIYTTDEQVFMDTVEKMASFNIVDSVSVPSILHLRGKDPACARRRRSSPPARPCAWPARASAAPAVPACRSSTASPPPRSRPRCSPPATPTSACGRATAF